MGSHHVTAGVHAPFVLAAFVTLLLAPKISAQTLASFETMAPVRTSAEISTWTTMPSLSATWRDRSGWLIGGHLFNPTDKNAAMFGRLNYAATNPAFSFDQEHPSFLTAGLGYQDADGWRFGAEVHLIDVVDTGGLDRDGFTTDIDSLAIQWQSSPVVALGGVIPLGDHVTLCSGFTWNRNQVRPLDHAFNALAPGLFQSSFSVGLYWQQSHQMKWFANFRSGYADYLPADMTGALGNFATSHNDGALDVVALTFGIELAL
jgi:hypothetical protein